MRNHIPTDSLSTTFNVNFPFQTCFWKRFINTFYSKLLQQISNSCNTKIQLVWETTYCQVPCQAAGKARGSLSFKPVTQCSSFWSIQSCAGNGGSGFPSLPADCRSSWWHCWGWSWAGEPCAGQGPGVGRSSVCGQPVLPQVMAGCWRAWEGRNGGWKQPWKDAEIIERRRIRKLPKSTALWWKCFEEMNHD